MKQLQEVEDKGILLPYMAHVRTLIILYSAFETNAPNQTHQWVTADQPARHGSSIHQKHEAESTAVCLSPVRPRDSLPLQKALHTIL